MFTVEKDNTHIPSILIAEDDPSNYLLFEYILKNDYRLIHAHNGEEAIRSFKAASPDLILMDIKMPGIDGYIATATIRRISLKVPIIAVTACAFEKDKERILSSGFDAYLQKPVNIQELKSTILKFLES